MNQSFYVLQFGLIENICEFVFCWSQSFHCHWNGRISAHDRHGQTLHIIECTFIHNTSGEKINYIIPVERFNMNCKCFYLLDLVTLFGFIHWHPFGSSSVVMFAIQPTTCCQFNVRYLSWKFVYAKLTMAQHVQLSWYICHQLAYQHSDSH